jgi:hypothetical protein
MTPVRVSNGEGVIAPDVAKGNLADLEKARKGNREAISRIANLKLPISRIKGKGTGTSDSIEGELPANSFVLPTSTMKNSRNHKICVLVVLQKLLVKLSKQIQLQRYS